MKYLLLFTFYLFGHIAHAGGYGDFIENLKAKNSPQRIIYLHYVMGNEHEVVDNATHMKGFIAGLNNTSWTDPEFESHIKFFSNTYEWILEKDLTKRIALLNKYLKEYKKGSHFYATLLHQLGMSYYVQNEYAKAFQYFISANEDFEKIGFDKIPEAGVYLHDLALAYYTFKEYPQAMQLMQLSLKQSPFSQNLDIQRNNTIAASFMKMNNADSALYYLNQTMKVAESYKDSFWIAHTLYNKVLAQKLKPGKDSVQAYLETSIKLLEDKLNNNPSLRNSGSDEAMLLVRIKLQQIINLCKQNRLAEARQEMDKMDLPVKTSSHNNLFQFEQRNREFFVEYYDALQQYYRATGQPAQALIYLDSFYAAKEDVERSNNSTVLQLSNQQIKIGKDEAKIARMNFIRRINISLIMVLALGLAGAIMTLKFLRSRKEKEKAELTLKSQKLEHEVALKQSELTNAKEQLNQYYKNITHNSQIIESITSELEALKLNRENTQQDSAEIESKIAELRNARILTDDDWVNFQDLYEKAHNQLYHQLRVLKPKLTEAELRYLMLYSLGMNHKDMANAIGISPDSLRVTWNRIKKKYIELGTDTPEQLLNHLAA